MKPSCVEWQLCTIYWMAAVKQRKEKVRVKKEKWKLTKKVRVEEEKRKLTKEVGHNLIFCLIDWLTLDLTRLYYISVYPHSEYLLAWFLRFIFWLSRTAEYVTLSLTHSHILSVTFWFQRLQRALQSCRRHLLPFWQTQRQRQRQRHRMTTMISMTTINTKTTMTTVTAETAI